MPEIYKEIQPWGATVYSVDQEHPYVSFHTQHQLVEIFTNPHFGRMLFLDGVLQSTRSDQHLYHQALFDSVKGSLGNVLIAGGAEGDLAKLCLKGGATHVQMNDWDHELVHHIQSVEQWNSEVWTNSRFSYSSKDIVRFCEETTQSFDTVFLDLLDVNSEHDKENMIHILNWLRYVLEPKATIVVNIGRSSETAERFAKLLGKSGTVREILVPSFQEPWYFIRCVRGEDE